MTVIPIITAIYILILILVIIRIVYETNQSGKALAYIFLCVFIPVAGIIFYLVFGINYWNKKRYAKKVGENGELLKVVQQNVMRFTGSDLNVDAEKLGQHKELGTLLLKDLGSPITVNNTVTVYQNGEHKFPSVLETINAATHHIHLEYYIYECDEIGMAIIEALILKARDGVEVRFIYDDFGSPSISSALEKRMNDAGIEVVPFHKIKYYLLANRFNYRNHRKILIVDGHTAFVGGINVSDKYINAKKQKKDHLYWRDTHLRIQGTGMYYLQYLFLTDWNFCCDNKLDPSELYFADIPECHNNCYVQIAAGGPDSLLPTILYSLMQAINLAEEEVLITTPYFIPGDSMLDAICMAAMSGVKVKLLIPEKGDSRIVSAANRSYFTKLLQAGAEVYLYQKGFVHAKTLVSDRKLSIVGTANMDLRSFELNFEVNAVVYDEQIAGQLRKQFFEDLRESVKIDPEQWLNRPWWLQLPEKMARLASPIL
jgi:cardiolipin synthase